MYRRGGGARDYRALRIPTIGIGAALGAPGQILVSNDMLGQFTWFTPKHVKRYANLAEVMRQAFATYKREVESGEFPATNRFSAGCCGSGVGTPTLQTR